jgi:hypothetical protein
MTGAHRDESTRVRLERLVTHQESDVFRRPGSVAVGIRTERSDQRMTNPRC